MPTTTITGDRYTITLTRHSAGGATLSSNLYSDDAPTEYRGAIHGVESVVLAHFVAGIDVTHPVYVRGLNDALAAIDNHL